MDPSISDEESSSSEKESAGSDSEAESSSETDDKEGPTDSELVNGNGEKEYVRFDVLEEEKKQLTLPDDVKYYLNDRFSKFTSDKC